MGREGNRDLEKGQKTWGEVRETEKGEREKQADQGEGDRGGIGDGAGATIILLHAAAPGSQQVAAQVLMAAGDDTSYCL